MEHISAILANCWWMILLSALIAYLLGSINTAVLVTGIVTKGKKDIRQMGSGNAGFTNVLSGCCNSYTSHWLNLCNVRSS